MRSWRGCRGRLPGPSPVLGMAEIYWARCRLRVDERAALPTGWSRGRNSLNCRRREGKSASHFVPNSDEGARGHFLVGAIGAIHSAQPIPRRLAISVGPMPSALRGRPLPAYMPFALALAWARCHKRWSFHLEHQPLFLPAPPTQTTFLKGCLSLLSCNFSYAQERTRYTNECSRRQYQS
jgi:hypothetical protein